MQPVCARTTWRQDRGEEEERRGAGGKKRIQLLDSGKGGTHHAAEGAMETVDEYDTDHSLLR